MLRSSVAFLLIITMLSANFNRFFIYASFEINRNYIASKLCENKAKPQLQCRGKCYLAKKIKQAEQKEKDQENTLQKRQLMDAVLNSRIDFKLFFKDISDFKKTEIAFLITQRSSLIFHPPQA